MGNSPHTVNPPPASLPTANKPTGNSPHTVNPPPASPPTANKPTGNSPRTVNRASVSPVPANRDMANRGGGILTIPRAGVVPCEQPDTRYPADGRARQGRHHLPR